MGLLLLRDDFTVDATSEATGRKAPVGGTWGRNSQSAVAGQFGILRRDVGVLQGSGSTTDVSITYNDVAPGTPQWGNKARVRWTSVGTTARGGVRIGFSTTGQTGYLLWYTGNGNLFQILKLNATGVSQTLTGTTSQAFTPAVNTYYEFELRRRIEGSTVYLDCYRDGVLRFTATDVSPEATYLGNGFPDYYARGATQFDWVEASANDNAPATQLSVALSARRGAAGTPVTVTVEANGTLSEDKLVALSDGGAGGTFSPPVVTLGPSSLAPTATYSGGKGGVRGIVASASGLQSSARAIYAATVVWDGTWTWFSAPRAIQRNGWTYMGWVDAAGGIGVTRVNVVTKAQQSKLLWTSGQADDHNNAIPCFLPDGRLIVFLTRHNDAAGPSFRICGDLEAFEDDASWTARVALGIVAGRPTSYVNPVVLGATLYLFFRSGQGGASNAAGLAYRKVAAASVETLAAWSATIHVCDSGDSATEYFCIARTSDTRADIAITSAHPVEGQTSLYHLYLDTSGGTDVFRQSGGTAIAAALPFTPASAATLVYNGAAARCWVCDIKPDADGRPHVLFQVYPNNNGTLIRYNHARWTGSAWSAPVMVIEDGPGLFTAEPYYGRLACFDGNRTDRVFAGRLGRGGYAGTVGAGTPGTPPGELVELRTTDYGSWTEHRAVTTLTDALNFRPISPEGHTGEIGLLFLTTAGGGRYNGFDGGDYSTSIVFDAAESADVPPPEPWAIGAQGGALAIVGGAGGVTSPAAQVVGAQGALLAITAGRAEVGSPAASPIAAAGAALALAAGVAAVTVPSLASIEGRGAELAITAGAAAVTVPGVSTIAAAGATLELAAGAAAVTVTGAAVIGAIGATIALAGGAAGVGSPAAAQLGAAGATLALSAGAAAVTLPGVGVVGALGAAIALVAGVAGVAVAGAQPVGAAGATLALVAGVASVSLPGVQLVGAQGGALALLAGAASVSVPGVAIVGAIGATLALAAGAGGVSSPAARLLGAQGCAIAMLAGVAAVTTPTIDMLITPIERHLFADGLPRVLFAER